MLVFLLLLASSLALLGPWFRRPLPCRCPRCRCLAAPAAPTARSLGLAWWCGIVVRRLGREFYFWCVDDIGEA